MTTMLRELVSRLEQLLPGLRGSRYADAFANDLFEAVDDLIGLGHFILAGDTRVNYPARVHQDQELWKKLESVLLGRPPEDVQRYQPIFDVARQILLIAQDVETPKEGHLGFLKIVREQFGFLQTDYGFAIVSEEPVSMRFSSGKVYIELAWAKNFSSSCSFGCEPNPSAMFWIDDLLFLYGDERYKSLPEELVLDSQNAIEQWVGFLADAFRRYGHELLSGRGGICNELTVAQEAKDREYIRENERRYNVGSDLT